MNEPELLPAPPADVEESPVADLPVTPPQATSPQATPPQATSPQEAEQQTSSPQTAEPQAAEPEPPQKTRGPEKVPAKDQPRDPVREAQRELRRTGRLVLWPAAMAGIALFVAGFVIPRLPEEDDAAAVSLLALFLILLLPALICARYLDLRAEKAGRTGRAADARDGIPTLPSFREALRLRLPRPDQLPLLLYATLALIAGTLLLDMFFGAMPDLMGRYALYGTFPARLLSASGAGETGAAGPLAIPLLLVIYALVPAVCEECLYRGLLCTAFEPFGLDCALILSALFSGFLSGSLRRLPGALFLGLLLGAVTYATRTVAVPILVHFLYHAFCIFARPWLAGYYVRTGSAGIFVFLLVCLFLLTAALFCREAASLYRARVEKLYAVCGVTASSGETRTTFKDLLRDPPEDLILLLPRLVRTLPRRLLDALSTPAAPLCLLVWLLTVIF